MTARVYCAVLLCLSGCLSTTEAAPGTTVKPGVCPSTKYEAEECTWIRFVSCADDSVCANNEKCCNNGCGLQCMAPDTAKPGKCPITNNGTIMCVRQDDKLCAGDSECPDNQKCCSTMCNGLDCMAPVTVKPGVCPRTNYEEVSCKKKGEELCAGDSECPKEEKCCRTKCDGLDCMAPVTVKPGVCPRRKYKPEICAQIRFASCADDRECPKNEKCCNNGCGLQCMAPVTVKPGVCPYIKYVCMVEVEDKCADDSECPKKEKCCGTACNGRQCTAPVTVKPGMCPRRKYKPEICFRIRFASCADDRECPKNEKCCNNGCGLQCMAPVTV